MCEDQLRRAWYFPRAIFLKLVWLFKSTVKRNCYWSWVLSYVSMVTVMVNLRRYVTFVTSKYACSRMNYKLVRRIYKQHVTWYLACLEQHKTPYFYLYIFRHNQTYFVTYKVCSVALQDYVCGTNDIVRPRYWGWTRVCSLWLSAGHQDRLVTQQASQ